MQKSSLTKSAVILLAKIECVLIFDDFVGRLFVDRPTNSVYAAVVIVYNGR